MRSVSFRPRQFRQVRPSPDKSADRKGLLRVRRHDAAQNRDLVAEHSHDLLDRSRRQALGLVERQGSPGQHYPRVGLFVGHGQFDSAALGRCKGV